MRLRALGLLWFLLAASLLLSCHAGKTENRDIRGYKRSGKFWPKVLLPQAIRSSPGVLWFIFFFFVLATIYSWVLLLLAVRTRGWSKSTESDEDSKLKRILVDEARAGLEALMQAQLATCLLYVSLSVAQLSDLIEAYLVGLCSVQLLLDAGRPRKIDNVAAAFITLLSFTASAVVAISLLDSFRALNVLNLCYSIIGQIPVVLSIFIAPLKAGTRWKKAGGLIISVWHYMFLIAAYNVARGVEGTHRTPMLTFLSWSGVNSILVSIAHWNIRAE